MASSRGFRWLKAIAIAAGVLAVLPLLLGGASMPHVFLWSIVALLAVIADRLRPAKPARPASDASTILDQTFDGVADVVTYDTRDARNLMAPLVVEGAAERGYSLVHDEMGALTFKRDAD